MNLPTLPASSARYESEYVYETEAVRVAIKQTPNASATEHLVDVISRDRFRKKEKIVFPLLIIMKPFDWCQYKYNLKAPPFLFNLLVFLLL